MQNIEMTVQGTILTIRVDLSKQFGPSKSGKTIVIASTQGNKAIPLRGMEDITDLLASEGFYVGLNVYKYPEPKCP